MFCVVPPELPLLRYASDREFSSLRPRNWRNCYKWAFQEIETRLTVTCTSRLFPVVGRALCHTKPHNPHLAKFGLRFYESNASLNLIRFTTCVVEEAADASFFKVQMSMENKITVK